MQDALKPLLTAAAQPAGPPASSARRPPAFVLFASLGLLSWLLIALLAVWLWP